MTIKKILSVSAQQLFAYSHELENSWFEAETLLAHVLKKDRVWIKAHDDDLVSKIHTRRFQSLIKRKQMGEPLAYLVGQIDFYGQTFSINHDVLIPRIETEDLLYKTRSYIIKYFKKSTHFLIWDVGTGSGALAISLARLGLIRANRRIRIIASDIDGKALMIAQKNARRLHVQKIKFIQADLLDKKIQREILKQVQNDKKLHQNNRMLTVVANLPYLPLTDRKRLSISVTKFEPGRALFTKEQGLFLIHRLMKQLSKFLSLYFLSPSSYLFLFEFDPPQATQIKRLAKKYFPTDKILIHRDQFKRNRFLEITSRAQQTLDHRS